MKSAKTKDPIYDYCRGLPGVTEDVKWRHDLVFSVGGKMFAAFQLPDGEPIGLKAHPDLFAHLVTRPGITPAPYMAKHSWVKLETRRTVPMKELKSLLAEAHALVASKLPKKVQASLGLLPGGDPRVGVARPRARTWRVPRPMVSGGGVITRDAG